jgi:hypothetical protein
MTPAFILVAVLSSKGWMYLWAPYLIILQNIHAGVCTSAIITVKYWRHCLQILWGGWAEYVGVAVLSLL